MANINIYKALVLPHLDYAYIVWDGLDKGLSTRLQKIQNHAAMIITRSIYNITPSYILADLECETRTREATIQTKK